MLLTVSSSRRTFDQLSPWNLAVLGAVMGFFAPPTYMFAMTGAYWGPVLGIVASASAVLGGSIGYGLVAAVLAWLWITEDPGISLLDLLLFGFAMVVPPAIAIGYIFYWKGTSERGVFWGMVTGYGGGLLNWGLNTLYEGVENANAGGFAQFWYEFCQFLGEWRDPTFAATLIPLVVIPLVSLLRPDEGKEELCEEFYVALKGARA